MNWLAAVVFPPFAAALLCFSASHRQQLSSTVTNNLHPTPICLCVCTQAFFVRVTVEHEAQTKWGHTHQNVAP